MTDPRAEIEASGNDKGALYAAARRVESILDEAVISGALTAEERRAVRLDASGQPSEHECPFCEGKPMSPDCGMCGGAGTLPEAARHAPPSEHDEHQQSCYQRGDETLFDWAYRFVAEHAARPAPPSEGLREALEDSMQDIGLGTDERIDRATGRVRATALAAIDSVKLGEASLPGDGFDSWADGFRQGWLAAREAVERA